MKLPVILALSAFLLILLLPVVSPPGWFGNPGRVQEHQGGYVPAGTGILPPVRAGSPEFGDLHRVFRINGHVESSSVVTVLPKTGGTLIELFTDVGREVTKGEIIGRIDPRSQELTLGQAETALRTARSAYDRVDRLFRSNSVSPQVYEEARARYEAAESRYELAKIAFQDTQIIAPMSGTVLKKHVSQGALVGSTVPVLTIGDIQKLNIRTRIPEHRYGFFQENQSTMNITVTVPALENRQFAARLSAIAPAVSPQTRSFEVTLTPAEPVPHLRPGMFVNMEFLLEERNGVFSLPFGALSGDGHLWILDIGNVPGEGTDPETAVARSLKFEPGFTGDDRFQVPDKWQDHRFILEGFHFLREGQQVRVVK